MLPKQNNLPPDCYWETFSIIIVRKLSIAIDGILYFGQRPGDMSLARSEATATRVSSLVKNETAIANFLN